MNGNRQGFVVVIPFASKDEVIMIRKHNSKDDSFTLEVPTDWLRESESPGDASVRILMDIGFKAKENLSMGEYEVFDAPIRKGYIFFASGLNAIPIDSRKDLTIIALHEVEQILLSNEVTTASSIIALYRVLKSRYPKN